jgi:hypothetical protein
MAYRYDTTLYVDSMAENKCEKKNLIWEAVGTGCASSC